jgi:GWxTD domain-containing protein
MGSSVHVGIVKGRLEGGPLLLPLLVFLGACASATIDEAGGAPARGGSPLEVYRESGMLTGAVAFPAVAAFATLAGPADSTMLLVGLSLPNSALRFTREDAGFAAEYGVALELLSLDSLVRRRAEWRETVRVSAFAETTRTDESVIFQQAVVLRPGRYAITLAAGDRNSARGFRARDTVDVPAFTTGSHSLAPPIVVYEAEGRTDPAAMPVLILNPRRTVAYGGGVPRIYLERYDDDATPVALRIRDAADSVVWADSVHVDGGSAALRHATLAIPPDELPLGRLVIEAEAAGERARQVPLLVTVSDQWMVANFDEVLQFIAYIASDAELDSLRTGSAAQRRAQWDAFWARRDPLPATTENEFRDDFFARIRTATLQFTEPGGRPGWQTARGEVYIVLGTPDQVSERYIGRSELDAYPNALEWHYRSVAGSRLTLLFLDRSGLGRYELDAASLAAFRAAARKLR